VIVASRVLAREPLRIARVQRGMKTVLTLSVLLGAFALTAWATEPAPATTAPASQPTSRPVVSIFYEHSYPPPGMKESRRLIIAVYADGTLRWSDDQAMGGAPYRAAHVSPERVTRLLDDLHALGFFTDPDVAHHRISYGPDASYTVLAAERGDARQRLASWHDPAPRGSLIVTEHGLSAIQPGQPVPQASPSYHRFTQVWAQARKLIYDLLPTAEEPLDKRVFDVGREARKAPRE